MAGRRPKPTAVRIAEGESPTRGRGHSRPIEGDDFTPPVAMPEMPKGLSPVARREWKFMCRVLLASGVITEVDRQCLATYCEAVALKENARKMCRATGGEVIPKYADELGEEGERIVVGSETNPWHRVWMDAVKVEKSALVEFGLTPASRARLKLPQKPKENEFEKFMGQKPTVAPVEPEAADLLN